MKWLLIALLLSLPVHAQEAAKASAPASASTVQAPAAQGGSRIVAAADVVDPMFRIHAKVVGLDRTVEMLQWRKADQPAPSHYEMAWTAERIDSSGFDAAHHNGIEFPFNGQRWWTTDAKLEGHPLAADVLGALDAWTPLKPDLSQLPPNMAVSFQPDGDWLSTSQDPAHPQIGDLRVRWRAIVDAPSPPGIALVAGRWEMPSSTASASASASAETETPTTGRVMVPGAASDAARVWSQRLPANLIQGLVVAVIAIVLLVLVWLWGRRSAGKPGKRKRKSGKR